MLPYKTILQIEKNSDTPVYLQIANAFAREIRNGLIKPGIKLPGERSLAGMVGVHRNTIAAVYDELNIQGYIEILPKKGAFISERIPQIKPKIIQPGNRHIKYPEACGYSVPGMHSLPTHPVNRKGLLEFDDGLPDERIAPLQELTRTYRSLFQRGSRLQFGYSEPEGNHNLREVISGYLNETRGLQTSYENVFITRGSQMGIFLVAMMLLQKGDIVLVGETSYPAADATFRHAGARLERIKIDHLGIDTDAIEAMCKKRKIRAVYVTPHHHYPTTTTLSACRRMNLLQLAERYGFVIIEDDYDYDFHYKSSPILPLASADNKGMVINIGSFSKNFSPALRVGYLVAPKNVIATLAQLRFIIDRQGDYLLEQAIAELMKEGTIKRYLRKNLHIYQERRDFLCRLMQNKLSDAVNFNIPAGGLALWIEFRKPYSLKKIANLCLKKGLIINDGLNYSSKTKEPNGTRLGFASLDLEEIEKCFKMLSSAVKER